MPSSRNNNQCPTSTASVCPNQKAILNPSSIERTGRRSRGWSLSQTSTGNSWLGCYMRLGPGRLLSSAIDWSKKENAVMVTAAKALEAKGISTFRFDFAGNGECKGTFQYGMNYVLLLSTSKELIGVAGGNVVLLYASKFQDIDAVVGFINVESRQGSCSHLYGERIYSHRLVHPFASIMGPRKSLMDRMSMDMHEASCLKINKSCRVLTVRGTADEIIPVEDAQWFGELIPSHELHVIKGANLSYTSHLPELASIVKNFLYGPGMSLAAPAIIDILRM
ncbi:hypothetical protein MLD38_015066 [Melastoma candidum]|uniref:Uncharacterized protein n=1 Tax=Melastoma candidum TaxID=119954 RepID=A0ACB9RES4_9MYRT|nr:hypothetical protein MLD38_015066 [Melastoma candidum]